MAVGLCVILCACSPSEAEKAQGASREAERAARIANEATEKAAQSATLAVVGHLSSVELAKAQAGALKGSRSEADKLVGHYFLAGPEHQAERRRWLSVAAATGSDLAVKRYIWVLLEDGNPADCAEAQSLIDAATARYLAEDNTAELSEIRKLEADIKTGACGPP